MWFRRRISMQDKPLLIINFFGVIGDIIKPNGFADTGSFNFVLRSNSIQCLRSL
jgi:hypothetical protein